MRFSTDTFRNNALPERFLEQYRKQKLNDISDTYLLDVWSDYHGKQHEKSILVSDGMSTINANHITNQTVVFKKGTAALTIANGQINVFNGWVSDIELSDGTKYELGESIGIIVYDKSGNNNHGTINGSLSWSTIRDKSLINYTNEVGYTKGIQLIPFASSRFETDGTAFYGTNRATKTWNSIEQSMTVTSNSNINFGLTVNGILETGKKYKVKFRAKTTNFPSNFKSIGNNADVGTVISNPILNNEWQEYDFDIIATQSLLRIYVDVGASIGSAFTIDDILVIESEGIIIPRNESSPSRDVLGGNLEFVGKVAADMKLINSNCAIVTNSTVAQFNYALTGLTILSYEGTATPTLDTVNDTITFTAGTFYNLKLSNNDHFPIAEGLQSVSYSVANREKQITWTSVTWGLQNTYHHNITKGFTKGVNRFAYSEDFNQWSTNFALKNEFLTSGFTDPLGGNTAFRINNSLGQNFTLQRHIENVANHTISMWIRTYDNSTITKSLLYGNNVSNGFLLTVTPEWQRFSFTTTSTSNSTTWGIYSITGEIDVLIAFAQMEPGKKPTPYQKTDTNANAGVYLPYELPTGFSNHATFGHNGAETNLIQEVFREDLANSAFHYDQLNLTSEVINYAAIVNTDEVFVDVYPNCKVDLETFSNKIVNQTNRKNKGLRERIDTLRNPIK